MKIGVFDSGRGGTTVMSAIKKMLPNEEYFYIGDSKNCPYGEKSDQELKRIVSKNTEELYDWGADIVVIACNTATTRCIEYLRKKYPEITFVGTEPAIKLAMNSGARKILVMATPGTVESERTAKLLAANRQDYQEIKLLACPGLADAIEANSGVGEKLEELIGDIAKDFDAVVLGCTHYSLIKAKIQKYFPGAVIMDGNEGVAKRVKNLLR